MTYVFALTYQNGDEGTSEIKTYHDVDEELTDEQLYELIGDTLHSNPDAIACEFKYCTERSEG